MKEWSSYHIINIIPNSCIWRQRKHKVQSAEVKLGHGGGNLKEEGGGGEEEEGRL